MSLWLVSQKITIESVMKIVKCLIRSAIWTARMKPAHICTSLEFRFKYCPLTCNSQCVDAPRCTPLCNSLIFWIVPLWTPIPNFWYFEERTPVSWWCPFCDEWIEIKGKSKISPYRLFKELHTACLKSCRSLLIRFIALWN